MYHTFPWLVQFPTIETAAFTCIRYHTYHTLRYKSQPCDWEQFAHHDDETYTRNLVSRGNGRWVAGALALPYPPLATHHMVCIALSPNTTVTHFW